MGKEGYFDSNILNGSDLGDGEVGEWLQQSKAEEKEEASKNFRYHTRGLVSQIFCGSWRQLPLPAAQLSGNPIC